MEGVGRIWLCTSSLHSCLFGDFIHAYCIGVPGSRPLGSNANATYMRFSFSISHARTPRRSLKENPETGHIAREAVYSGCVHWANKQSTHDLVLFLVAVTSPLLCPLHLSASWADQTDVPFSLATVPHAYLVPRQNSRCAATRRQRHRLHASSILLFPRPEIRENRLQKVFPETWALCKKTASTHRPSHPLKAPPSSPDLAPPSSSPPPSAPHAGSPRRHPPPYPPPRHLRRRRSRSAPQHRAPAPTCRGRTRPRSRPGAGRRAARRRRRGWRRRGRGRRPRAW